MKYGVQHRRGTAQRWLEKKDVIPQDGEFVAEMDYENALHKFKIGDGIHSYEALPYFKTEQELTLNILPKVRPNVRVIILSADSWAQSETNATTYTQTVFLDGLTEYSKVDLQPDANMLAELQQLGLILTTENINGTLVVYAMGSKPTKTYEVQVEIVETNTIGAFNKMLGMPIGVAASATIDLEEIDGGYKINVSDVNGTTSCDIRNGKDGCTPVKGVDYYTDVEQQEMVSRVLAALPVYRGELADI